MSSERVRPELWPHSGLPVRELVAVNTGNIILVDGDYDGEWFASYPWRQLTAGYVTSHVKNILTTNSPLYLARLVMGVADTRGRHLFVGYHNGNVLDCRSANLYLHTPSQAAVKRAIGSGTRGGGVKGGSASGYVGVGMYDVGRGPRYFVRGRDNKWIHSGAFTDPAQAARLYDAYAVKKWGRFAQLNFPREHMNG